MITKFASIKNLGLFREFKWDESLEDFCRYNLIYGWNGAGKTTLSRLFSALATGELSNYANLQYDVVAGTKRWHAGTGCDEKIRVFNRDYVLANVEKVGGPKPIFILGAENKEAAEQIARDEEQLGERLAEVDRLEGERTSVVKRKETLFTNVARTIGNTVAGESTRSYRRPNAEADFRDLREMDLLDDQALSAVRGTLGQQQKQQLDEVADLRDLEDALEGIHGKAEELLEQTVRAGVIRRLAEHHDIANWVEEGIALHENHGLAACEFCRSPIAQERLDQLAAHFSDADRALKRSVDDLSREVHGIISRIEGVSVRDAANLYEELAADYQWAVDGFLGARDTFRTEIQALAKQIEDKKANASEELGLDRAPDAGPLLGAIADVNAQIAKHNAKTCDFDQAKQTARETLKRHFLSEIFDEANDLRREIDALAERIGATRDRDPEDETSCSIQKLETRLSDARAKVSSSHAACKAINDQLAQFLGREELSFEVSGEGYEIRRFGEAANDLSESERTAVAFVHFVVQLSDRDFDLKKGIVVIDDPISSLDANSLFQAFAFLKESVKDASQVFILTHNVDFMRQVKSWLFHIKKTQRSFYMVKNIEKNGAREAALAPMDRLLMEFESEYHYLFSLLHAFHDDGSLEAIYNFPNIGRKFLETFLAFKVPSHENLHHKMGHIEYDEAKKTAILRFVQTHSHARRSDGVLNFDMSLSRGGQTAIRSLLGMVKAVDKTHYETLLAAVSR
jgi:wobble nucleotide-excising tRNase